MEVFLHEILLDSPIITVQPKCLHIQHKKYEKIISVLILTTYSFRLDLRMIKNMLQNN